MIVKPDKLAAIFLSKTDNSVSDKLNVYYNNNLIPGRGTGGRGEGSFWPAAYFDPK